MKTVSIDEKIKRAEENLVKAKEKYTEATRTLEELIKKKKAIQTEELMNLFANSNRSYEEMVAFLKAGMTEEQLARGSRKKPGPKSKSGI